MVSRLQTLTTRLRFLVPAGALVFYSMIQVLGADAPAAEPGFAVSVLILPILLATVIAAVLHAEEIAHDVGEPYGTLVLTVSVTIIEVALIMSITLSGKGDPALARDTVFSVIMIVCNGIVGLCIVAGGLQYRAQDFEVMGASAYLAVLTALSVLTLVLPNFTHSSSIQTLSPGQLAFVSVVTLLLYGVFLYIQTVRHRDFFTEVDAVPDDLPPLPKSKLRALRTPAVLLIASLTAVVLLSKTFATSVKTGLAYVGAPAALSGFLVAMLILLPESVAAFRACIALYFGHNLESQAMVLLFVTLVISTLTFGTGRTNILYGFVHLIIFATYVFLIFLP